MESIDTVEMLLCLLFFDIDRYNRGIFPIYTIHIAFIRQRIIDLRNKR